MGRWQVKGRATAGERHNAMKRIVAAIDDAESSLQVASLAAELAVGLAAELILVTVGRAIDGAQPELERYRFE